MIKKILSVSFVALTSLLRAQNYQVSTVAGNGTQGFVDGSATTTCELNYPYGVAYDGTSAIYFTDTYNNAIRKLDLTTNIVSTISSTGFNVPLNLFFKNNFLYISDNGNNVIKKIDLLNNNTVSIIAGSGTQGYQNGAANQAQFNAPAGIFVDANNTIYVADGYNYCVRKISSTGVVSLVAGTPGTAGYVDGASSNAQFDRPRDLVMSSIGELFVTDLNNNVIRKISTSGVVSTFAGTGTAGAADGGPGVATLNVPVGIGITYNDYIYFIDGQGNKVRKVSSTGMVSTIAGNGSYGFVDGAAASAEFNIPQGVTYDGHGALYIGDRTNNRIRKISVPECDKCTGIEELASKNKISIYPNPSAGSFQLLLSGNNEKASIEIYNTLGELVNRQIATSSNCQINAADLANGVYTVLVSQKDKISTAKIIVQK